MEPVFAMMAAAAVAFWGCVLYLALRVVRAAERRGISRGELEEPCTRVTRLEEEIATANTEVERLAAAELFTAQLLVGRASENPPAI